jgi:hypothetical protein
MCTVGHWKDGVMTEEWLFWDNATYMKQIGIGQQSNVENARSIQLVSDKIKVVLLQFMEGTRN